jgi:hypothetical protein
MRNCVPAPINLNNGNYTSVALFRNYRLTFSVYVFMVLTHHRNQC